MKPQVNRTKAHDDGTCRHPAFETCPATEGDKEQNPAILSIETGNVTLKAACACYASPGKNGAIHFCPLHAAAPSLYAALKAIEQKSKRDFVDVKLDPIHAIASAALIELAAKDVAAAAAKEYLTKNGYTKAKVEEGIE